MRLKLAYYTDPVLRTKVERVNHIDHTLRTLVADMIETMHAHNGIGIAAPQVHQSIALFVTNVPIQDERGKWVPTQDRVFINPMILDKSKTVQTFSEGCLSIPNLYMHITRPSEIRIRATNLEGETFEETFLGFPATNFMHEYDHLQGILITDYYTQDEKKALGQLFIT